MNVQTIGLALLGCHSMTNSREPTELGSGAGDANSNVDGSADPCGGYSFGLGTARPAVASARALRSCKVRAAHRVSARMRWAIGISLLFCKF